MISVKFRSFSRRIENLMDDRRQVKAIITHKLFIIHNITEHYNT